MSKKPISELRRGWTTGACATAAAKGAMAALQSGAFAQHVTITLPRGETPRFALAEADMGPGWAEAGVVKDAGDDPDVTHGALIRVRAAWASKGAGLVIRAGKGVGMVTRAGLPVPVGSPAINPVPRAMLTAEAKAFSEQDARFCDVILTISVPGGDRLAQQTWNPRLGIEGGLSILGTTGIVRPFSCAAWIASIHRGVDVARAAGLMHVAGTTGATSERVVQALHDLPDHAMLDMGDFAGGLLKYLRRNPVACLTIGGGIGKISKLAQGAVDLHSARSQVNFSTLADMAHDAGLEGSARIKAANTALEAVTLQPGLAAIVAKAAQEVVEGYVKGCAVDIVVIDRAGHILARSP